MKAFATATPLSRLRPWLLGLVLVAAIIFTYQPAWNAGFIWDDDEYVTHNPLLTAPDGLRRIWFSTDSPSQYFPLVYTSFRAQHALWGLDPRGYHWVNLLLHAVNALLVWRLFARLAIPGAWLGAALFALHPLQVESVAWITELKNVQSLFFSLLVLLAWLRFVERDERPAWGLYAAALVCHALALFSKTTACTLPAGLVLVLWWRRQPLTVSRWLQIAPFVVLGFVMGLVSIWWERHQQGTVGDDFAYGALERVLIASRALWFYLGKLVWPADLTFSYPLWKIDAADPLAYVWLAGCLALGTLVFILRRRTGRALESGLAFFVASLVPLLGFFMLYTFRYTFVADHYVYVALLGPAALAAAGFARLTPRLRAVHAAFPAALCTALLLALGTLSWRQSHMYRDLRTLWETTLARNPQSFMAHNNLAALDLADGHFDRAIAGFKRSLALKPDHIHALANLANAHLRNHRPDEALALFQRVLEIAPHDAKGHADLAQALIDTGRGGDPEGLFRRAVALDDRLAEAHHGLGVFLLRGNRPAEARPCFERAIALHDGYTLAHYHLGLVHLAESEPFSAAECFRRVLALEPGHAGALNNLGNLLFRDGQTDSALALYRRAIAASPVDADAHNNLGWAFLELNRPAEAAPAFETALRYRPDFAAARLNLVQAFLQLGRLDPAVATLEQHVARNPADPDAQFNLGCLLIQSAQTARALSAFDQTLSLSPDHVPALATLGWLLATTPEPRHRNPARAHALARRAQEIGGEDPRILRALAAAEAALGHYAAAAVVTEKALRLADAQGNEPLRAELALHLTDYRAGRPLSAPAPL